MDKAGVQTRFMDGGCEVEDSDAFVGVIFPQARRLRVSLECAMARDDFTGEEGGGVLDVEPTIRKMHDPGG